MLKLRRSVKPYMVMLLAAVAFLFGQAFLELTLPNMMSDIVNVGIQQGGIQQAAPEAIGKDAMQFMQMFMSEKDKEAVQGAYSLGKDTETFPSVQEKYPNLSREDWILTADASTSGAEGAFPEPPMLCSK